jgi:hypothetical protein
MDGPEPWLPPGFNDHAIFVRWLNKEWENLAAKKHGKALFLAAAKDFRLDRPETALIPISLIRSMILCFVLVSMVSMLQLK